MSWMVSEHMLDPDQRMLLDRIRLNDEARYWIRGPVGSGKSILLVHALANELRQDASRRAAVVVYTHSLIDMFRSGLPKDLDGRVDIMTNFDFMSRRDHYHLVVVDEVQDLKLAALKACASKSDRLMVAGDPFQSIYDDTVTSEQIIATGNVKPFDLSILHRLTPKIIDIAQLYCRDTALLSAKRGKLRNVDVARVAGQGAGEFRYVWSQASDLASKGYSTAILLPKHDYIQAFVNRVCGYHGYREPEWIRKLKKFDYDKVNRHLSQSGINLQYVGNGFGSFQTAGERNQVVIMTYHSCKGMDFEAVFLPHLHPSTNVWKKDLAQQDTLFFVALTRSRENLILSYADEPHPLIARIPAKLVKDMDAESIDEDTEEAEDDDDFVF